MSAPIPIVALDVRSAGEAFALVDALGDTCSYYKVGLELFSAEGPAIIRTLVGAGHKVFVDLKLHDIPNTVRSAARAVATHGASLLTVHASGGVEMMRAAVEGAVDGSQLAGSDADARCGILGVTVLTSHTAETQALAWGRPAVDVQVEVQRLAGDTVKAGAAGIVCSGHEAAPVRALFGDRLGLLIPGIRLEGGSTHDQQRVMTPRDAGVAGANWIILGRAVTGADDPRLAMTLVHEQLSSL